MSEEAAAPKKKKKGKLGRILLLGGIAAVLIGGGTGAGLFLSGAVGGSAAHAEVDPNQPQRVARKDSKGNAEPGEYESTYFPLEKEFTSNLKDSIHFVQIGLAVATDYDDRVVKNVEKHQLPIRSAVLMTLGDTDEEQVLTPEGKARLQARLTAAINATLQEKAGFGGVGNVYFTNFIVQ